MPNDVSQSPTSKFRCVMMGAESLLIACAESVLQRGHDICAIVTRNEQIRQWALQRDMRVFARSKELPQALAQTPFEYLFSIGNLSIVPDEVLALPTQYAVNFHDGPLPRYAGLYATAWALMRGEREHGITFHIMTNEVDAGDILKQRTFAVDDGATSFTLNAKCYENAIDAFAELVDEIGTEQVERRSQTPDPAQYFGRLRRPEAAAAIDWQRPAAETAALVRGLDFGPIENPLAVAKLAIGPHLVGVTAVDVVDGDTAASDQASEQAPGTITRVDGDLVGIATGSGEIVLRGLKSLIGAEAGNALPMADFVAKLGPDGRALRAGDAVRVFTAEERQRLSEINSAICRHERYWCRRLSAIRTDVEPLDVPYATRSGKDSGADPAGTPASGDASAVASHAMALADVVGDTAVTADSFLTALGMYLARISDKDSFAIDVRPASLASLVPLDSDDGASAGASTTARFFAPRVPFVYQIDLTKRGADIGAAVAQEWAKVEERGTYATDVFARYPDLVPTAMHVAVDMAPIAAGEDIGRHMGGVELLIALDADGGSCHWHYDTGVYSEEAILAMQGQLAAVLSAYVSEPDKPAGELPLLSPAERKKVLLDWNATATTYPTEVCIHQLFEAQAERRPEAPALAFLHRELSYRALNSRANQLAHHLRELGVGPDTLVGVCVERSIEMMVAILGVLKAGGAYVPMDPGYPADRIALMLEDSEVGVLITQSTVRDSLPPHGGKTVCIDSDWEHISRHSDENPESGVGPSNLAYTIYTSGSTGRPKGVMVEHRNVVNFFAGMDDRVGVPDIDGGEPAVWLAVTSLSFDISVLELFWTLARGFKVVLHSDSADDAAVARRRFAHADKSISFSLMYFASDEGATATAADKYNLLIEGAKFGDQNGFSAVWTPERHFHAFGGLYPNPSVASAAIAMVTERCRILAGSCVLPLHPPIRVAEEWALVDNLSNGRVGISFAAGWQPNDFVLRPENFADRKNIMFRDIEVVRSLWRGESVTMTSPTGQEIEVRTLPRPVQAELPYWVTAAGNPETFIDAGRTGANILTHLLGQTTEELIEKVGLYRKAWADAGHPGRGEVNLMLHTFVGPDEEDVRDTVRQPMKDYLRSALNLVKAASWTFPTFKQEADASGKTPAQIFEEKDLTDEEMDALLDHAFHRYYQTSGLFGTPDTCLDIVDRVKGCDVDDIACLLDYGIPSHKVMAHLTYLNDLRQRANVKISAGQDFSLAAQIKRHGVTHFQCTPSQMSMILLDDGAKQALSTVGTIMIGGEAFPPSLAASLAQARAGLEGGRVINMYGPTETTIWSSTQEITCEADTGSIGRPIANTEIYLLDRRLQPVPVGVPGELYIGGDGVVRGYYQRPELTAERFVKHPFNEVAGARIYKTGDLARYAADGRIEFLGRADFQVKVRGYRIEPGEIEARLRDMNEVSEALVMAREDVPGDKRLVAYLIPAQGGQGPVKISVSDVRSNLRTHLPVYMVPSNFVTLDAFPLTPNGKIDRKALKAPEEAEAAVETVYVAPESDLEEQVASLWAEVLNVKKVGMDDNFFDMGGHSLLMVQTHRRLQELAPVPVALTDLFRFPTIRSLVGFLGQDGNASEELRQKSQDRAEARKKLMAQRKQKRQRRGRQK